MSTTTKKELSMIGKRSSYKEMAAILATSTDDKERRAAANAIYRAFHSTLYNYFIRKMGSSNDVRSCDDLTIVTLEKVMSKIAQYNPETVEFSTWVFNIAKNTLIDHVRKSRNRDVVAVEAQFQAFSEDDEPIEVGSKLWEEIKKEFTSSDPTPLAATIRAQEHSIVRAAVERMKSARERVVIKLRFFDQHSYEEIAEETDIPLNTVKVILHRAKRSLQRDLSPVIQR